MARSVPSSSEHRLYCHCQINHQPHHHCTHFNHSLCASYCLYRYSLRNGCWRTIPVVPRELCQGLLLGPHSIAADELVDGKHVLIGARWC